MYISHSVNFDESDFPFVFGFTPHSPTSITSLTSLQFTPLTPLYQPSDTDFPIQTLPLPPTHATLTSLKLVTSPIHQYPSSSLHLSFLDNSTPPSSPSTILIPSSLSSFVKQFSFVQNPPVLPIAPNHPMITRSKDGIFKTKFFHTSLTSD